MGKYIGPRGPIFVWSIMSTITTNVEDVAKLLSKGIAADLMPLIEAELHTHIDPILKNLAKKLAAETVVKMQAYQKIDYANGLGPTIQMQLVFNNESVDYKA